MKLIYYIGLLSIFLLACTDDVKKIEGNGDVQSKTFEVEDFKSVESNGAFEITFVQDTLWSVIIEAESNILPLIDVYNKSNKLFIEQDDHDDLNLNDPIKIEIHHSGIEEFNFSGEGVVYLGKMESSTFTISIAGTADVSGNVKSTETDFILAGTGSFNVILDCYDLEASLSGNGSFNFSGVSTKGTFTLAGVGNINSIDLELDYAWCNISGVGDATLFVNKELSANITGTGSISYKGEAAVTKLITGNGVVNKIN